MKSVNDQRPSPTTIMNEWNRFETEKSATRWGYALLNDDGFLIVQS